MQPLWTIDVNGWESFLWVMSSGVLFFGNQRCPWSACTHLGLIQQPLLSCFTRLRIGVRLPQEFIFFAYRECPKHLPRLMWLQELLVKWIETEMLEGNKLLNLRPSSLGQSVWVSMVELGLRYQSFPTPSCLAESIYLGGLHLKGKQEEYWSNF